MKEISWNSLVVREDGTITDTGGNLKKECLNGRISYSVNGNPTQKCRERIVYEAFSGRALLRTEAITFADGNRKNCAFDNLRCVSLKSVRNGNGFKNDARLFDEKDVERICRDFHLKGSKSREDFARENGCSLATLKKIIGGTYQCRK